MNSTAAARAASTADPELHDAPFSPTVVEDLLRQLGKTARAHQLYLHNNPTYLRALDQLRATFVPLWEKTDELVLAVAETELRWEGRAVLVEQDKSSEALPWLFFKDGIRELRLTPGFEQDELPELLDLLAAVRRVGNVEDDLITLLWERDLAHLRYRYVDLQADGVFAFRGANGDGELAPTVLAEPVVAQPAAGLVRIDDYEGTLHFLNADEVEYLRDCVEREYNRDLRSTTTGMLLDIFELHGHHEGAREDACAALETLLVHLLMTGSFRSVATLLREVRATLERCPEASAAHRARLARLPELLSAGDALRQLLEALDGAAELPPEGEIEELFGELRPTALGPVFGALETLQAPRLRTALRAAADRLAAAHTGELVRLIASGEPAVALEATRRAGALRAAAAVPALAARLRGSDAALRVAAAHALAEIGSPGALQALETLIADADRDIRVLAARAIGARGYRVAVPRLEALLRSKGCREADLTEKMTVFEAFGSLCGDDGVPFLDGLLNGRGMLGRREDAAFRACAAMALGRVGSPAALKALQRASDEKDAVVRTAVSRAMRGPAA
jgi:hypothetical protein